MRLAARDAKGDHIARPGRMRHRHKMARGRREKRAAGRIRPIRPPAGHGRDRLADQIGQNAPDQPHAIYSVRTSVGSITGRATSSLRRNSSLTRLFGASVQARPSFSAIVVQAVL